MNKRKRTAYRRAALWPRRTAREVADAINDRVPFRVMSEVVFARGVWHDDGREVQRLFPDRWEDVSRQMTVEEAADEIDAIVAAEAEQRGGPVPTLVVAPDDGTARARFRADMARAKTLGLVPTDLDGATVMRIAPITRTEG